MDDVFRNLKRGNNIDIYNSLSRLYDYLWAHEFYDYNNQTRRIKNHAPDQADSYLELACGPGRTLGKVEDYFESVFAIDSNEGMVEIAQERNPGISIEIADMSEYSPPSPVDCIGIMGFCLGEFSSAELSRIFNNSYNNLWEGGNIIIEHLEEDAIDGDYYEKTSRHPDGYEITIRSVSVVDGSVEKKANSYEMIDEETGDRALGGELNEWRQYSTNSLTTEMNRIGFDTEIIPIKDDPFDYGESGPCLDAR